jgi:hypothetical protein
MDDPYHPQKPSLPLKPAANRNIINVNDIVAKAKAAGSNLKSALSLNRLSRRIK